MTDNKILNDEQLNSTDKYDCNLALYLNLPEYFHNAGKMIPEKYYFKLKKSLENTPNKKNKLINNILLVLSNMNSQNLRVKELLVIYIYVFLDTQPAIDLLLSHKPL